MKSILRTSVIPAVVAVVVLAGCGGEGSDSSTDTETQPDTATETEAGGGAPSGTLRVNFGLAPENWTPGAAVEGGYMRVPYENLVALDAEGEISPVLATEWEQTDTDLTLTLREDVTFHDGTPFDADAVKVNLELARDGTTPFAGPLKVIESIDVVDDHTVRLNLAQPAPSLLANLSTRSSPMGSPTAIQEGTIAQHPVGTGPWAYDSAASTPGTRMNFRFYPDYWGDPEGVGFETIELYSIPDENASAGALATGELDLVDLGPAALPQVEGQPGIETLSYPSIRNNPMFFDRGPGGAFEDVNVRRAACYALDTQAVVAVEPDFTPRTQHFAEGEVGYNPEIDGYPHDLERARELYEQAGSPPVRAEVLAAPFTQQQLEVYASQLAELGMEINVQVAPPPQYASTWNSGQYPLGLGSNPELTPYDWYRAWFAADAPGNPAGVESPELKAAADAAIAAGVSPEAEALWAQVTRVIADEALTCGHMAGEQVLVWRSDSVQDVSAQPQPWEPNSVDYRTLRPVEG